MLLTLRPAMKPRSPYNHSRRPWRRKILAIVPSPSIRSRSCDPFPLTDPFNLSSDNQTRVMLFATNLSLATGGNTSSVTARAQDAQMNIYPLTVEFVGAVPGFTWLTEVVVVLPGNMPAGQSLRVSVTWHLQTSNQARIRIK